MPKLSILHSPKTEKSLPKISNNFYTLHVVDDGDPQSAHRIDHIGTSVVCRVLSFQQL